jgi:hypothetical protein
MSRGLSLGFVYLRVRYGDLKSAETSGSESLIYLKTGAASLDRSHPGGPYLPFGREGCRAFRPGFKDRKSRILAGEQSRIPVRPRISCTERWSSDLYV